MVISRCFASLVDVEMMKRIVLRLKCALIVLMVSFPAGCGFYRTVRNEPPPSETRRFGPVNTSAEMDRPVLLLGRLENPRRSPTRWRDIGKGMTDMLSRELRAAGTYDAWISTRLAREVDSILGDLPTSRKDRFDSLRGQNPEIHYVILGGVTDFLHIQRRKGNPRGGRDPNRQTGYSEALVAIEFSVVDIESGRVVLTDHVTGSVFIEDGTVQESYRSMSFGSYRFWNTPLGEASLEAIGHVIYQIQQLPVPARQLVANAAHGETFEVGGESESSVAEFVNPERSASQPQPFYRKDVIRIVSQVHPRKIEVAWSRQHVVGVNDVYYVSRHDAASENLVSINDPDTGRPLRARIIATGKTGGTALLNGMKPANTDLRGAILTRQRASRTRSKMTKSSEDSLGAGRVESSTQ